MTVPLNWFESFFHGVTLDLWRQAIPPERTTEEAEFLGNKLNCPAGARVLDVPCGNGRLSFELAGRGYRVTGIDISKEFIDEARSLVAQRQDLTATNSGADAVEFLLGDMRYLEGEAIYDAAYCFGNSFAFLEYLDTQKFLAGVRRALKPGARFIVETGMAAESVLPRFEEKSSHEIGDMTLTVEERYIAEQSCIDSKYIFERNGKTETRVAREWIYTAAEIRRLLERAGFHVLEVYGSLKCEPYQLGAEELFLVSEARP